MVMCDACLTGFNASAFHVSSGASIVEMAELWSAPGVSTSQQGPCGNRFLAYMMLGFTDGFVGAVHLSLLRGKVIGEHGQSADAGDILRIEKHAALPLSLSVAFKLQV